jgi:hypothetical protein
MQTSLCSRSQESYIDLIHKQKHSESKHIPLPCLTCDPTTVKDLRRTPAKVSLSYLYEMQELVKDAQLMGAFFLCDIDYIHIQLQWQTLSHAL